MATGLGAFAPLAPLAAAGGVTAFILTVLATRVVSIASIVGTATLATIAFLTRGSAPVPWAAAFTGLLVIVKHHSNLQRLMAGTEGHLGTRKG